MRCRCIEATACGALVPSWCRTIIGFSAADCVQVGDDPAMIYVRMPWSWSMT